MFQAWDVEPNYFYPITILAFTTSLFSTKVHNMLSMMLDLRFKGMKVVKVCGEWWNGIGYYEGIWWENGLAFAHIGLLLGESTLGWLSFSISETLFKVLSSVVKN